MLCNCGRRGTLGFAVLANFSCGISVILILNCGIAVFSKPAGCVFFTLWSTIFGTKTYLLKYVFRSENHKLKVSIWFILSL